VFRGEAGTQLCEADFSKGDVLFVSPLTSAIVNRGVARFTLGIAGWKEDLQRAVDMARTLLDPNAFASVMWFKASALIYGALLPDDAMLRDTTELMSATEQRGDDFAVSIAQSVRGLTLVHCDGPQRDAGFRLLEEVRGLALSEQFSAQAVPVVDTIIAREKARSGDLDTAVGLARSVLANVLLPGFVWGAAATGVLVGALLQRGLDADLREAGAAIDKLAVTPIEGGLVPHEVWRLRLRALLARAHGDAAAYADFRDRYRDMAKTLGFEGHIAWAEAMP
jgi:adenylate cyclase